MKPEAQTGITEQAVDRTVIPYSIKSRWKQLYDVYQSFHFAVVLLLQVLVGFGFYISDKAVFETTTMYTILTTLWLSMIAVHVLTLHRDAYFKTKSTYQQVIETVRDGAWSLVLPVPHRSALDFTITSTDLEKMGFDPSNPANARLLGQDIVNWSTEEAVASDWETALATMKIQGWIIPEGALHVTKNLIVQDN